MGLVSHFSGVPADEPAPPARLHRAHGARRPRHPQHGRRNRRCAVTLSAFSVGRVSKSLSDVSPAAAPGLACVAVCVGVSAALRSSCSMSALAYKTICIPPALLSSRGSVCRRGARGQEGLADAAAAQGPRPRPPRIGHALGRPGSRLALPSRSLSVPVCDAVSHLRLPGSLRVRLWIMHAPPCARRCCRLAAGSDRCETFLSPLLTSLCSAFTVRTQRDFVYRDASAQTTASKLAILYFRVRISPSIASENSLVPQSSFRHFDPCSAVCCLLACCLA